MRVDDEYVWVYGEKFRWWPTANRGVKPESWNEALPGCELALALARDPLGVARKAVGSKKLENMARNSDFTDQQAKSYDGALVAWKEGRPPAGWNTWQEAKSKGSFVWDREIGSNAKGAARAIGVEGGCFLQSIKSEAGASYVVTAKARRQGRGTVHIRVRWQTAEGKWIAEDLDTMIFPDKSTSDWQPMLGLATAPEGVGRLVVLLGIGGQKNDSDVAWFDDVCVSRID